jgi:hypothetical protein
LGPFWDPTLCAVVNDLRVCERRAAPKLPPDTADQRKRVTAIF